MPTVDELIQVLDSDTKRLSNNYSVDELIASLDINTPLKAKEDRLLKGIGKSIVQGGVAFPKGFYGAGAVIEDVAYKAFGGSDEYPDLAKGGIMREQYNVAKDIETRYQPRQTGWRKYISDATRVIAQMASNTIGTAGVGTLPAMATEAGVDKYLQSREEGYSVPVSASAGTTSGLIEYITELKPIQILSKPGLSFLKRLAGGAVYDIGGELVATAANMKAVDEGILGKSYNAHEYAQALLDTAITSGLVTLGATAIVQPIHRNPATGLDDSKEDEELPTIKQSTKQEIPPFEPLALSPKEKLLALPPSPERLKLPPAKGYISGETFLILPKADITIPYPGMKALPPIETKKVLPENTSKSQLPAIRIKPDFVGTAKGLILSKKNMDLLDSPGNVFRNEIYNKKAIAQYNTKKFLKDTGIKSEIQETPDGKFFIWIPKSEIELFKKKIEAESPKEKLLALPLKSESIKLHKYDELPNDIQNKAKEIYLLQTGDKSLEGLKSYYYDNNGYPIGDDSEYPIDEYQARLEAIKPIEKPGQGKLFPTKPKETTLETFGFQSIYENLSAFVKSGKIKDGYNSLVDLANKVYVSGGFKSFIHDMKLALGNLWQHYKTMIPRIWRDLNILQQARVKSVLAREANQGKTLTDAQLKRIGMTDANIAALKKHKAQREKFTPLSELKNPVVRGIVEFFSLLATLPDSLKYKIERGESFGDVARIEKLVGKVLKKTQSFDEETKKLLFKFLDGKIKLTDLPQNRRRYAMTLQGMNRRIGQMLVKRGLITQKAWEENKHEYIRYVYLKYLLDDENIKTSGGKIDRAAFKGRMDPIIKSMVAGKEYVDKNIYEGLLKVAEILRIKHKRVMKAGRGKLGYASSDGETVTQFATELSVLAHEIGHQLDTKYDLWNLIVTNAIGVSEKSRRQTQAATTQQRGRIQNELRALADLTWEGSEVSAYYKQKVRKKAEKMAHMLEAYIHAPERFQEVAPIVYKEFDSFINSTTELQELSKLKQGLALKELQQMAYQVRSKGGKLYADNLTLEEAKLKKAEIQKEIDKYRKAIGWVEDVSIAEPMSISIPLQNIVAYDHLLRIADNPDWTWQPSVIGIDGKKWGIGALKEEMRSQAMILAENPDSIEIKERYDALSNGYKQAQEESGNEPDGFLALPTSAAYGPLSGMVVRKAIYRDLVPIFSGISNSATYSKTWNTLIKIEVGGMQAFKITHTALNLPTVLVNVVSNLIQLNWSGIPIWDVPVYMKKGIASWIKGDENYTAALRGGLLKSNFVEGELKEIYNQFDKMNNGSWYDIVGHLVYISKYYGKIDDITKMAKYVEQIENGVPHGQAMVEAQKWGMDYSLTHPSIKYVRTYAPIIPFATYAYKILPLFMETMVKRPWVIAKYFAIPSVMLALAKETLDLSDDEWEKLRKDLNLFARKANIISPLPYKSKEGNVVWLDIGKYFPAGMYLRLYKDFKNREFGEISRDIGIGNPFGDVYALIQSMRGESTPKDPFSGKEVYNTFDSGTEKALKFTEWFYNKWAPTMLTRYGFVGKAFEIGKENRLGNKGDVTDVVGSMVGVNTISPTPERTEIQRSIKIKSLVNDYYRKVLNMNPEDTKGIEAVQERFDKQMRNVSNQ